MFDKRLHAECPECGYANVTFIVPEDWAALEEERDELQADNKRLREAVAAFLRGEVTSTAIIGEQSEELQQHLEEG